MDSNPEDSVLLRVPREVRSEILRYLLNARYTRVPREVRIRDAILTQYAWRFFPAALRVNRQIHHEARDILGENEFVVVERPMGELKQEEVLKEDESTDGIISLWPGKPHIKHASVPGEQMRVQFTKLGKPEVPEIYVILLSELRDFCIAISRLAGCRGYRYALGGLQAIITIEPPKCTETPEARRNREMKLLKPLCKLRCLSSVTINGATPNGNLNTQRQMIRHEFTKDMIAESISEMLLEGENARKTGEFGIASAYFSRAGEHLAQFLSRDPSIFRHVADILVLLFHIAKHRALLGIESDQFRFAYESAKSALGIAKDLFTMNPPHISPPKPDAHGNIKKGPFRKWQCECIADGVKSNGSRIRVEDIGRCYYYQSIAEHVLEPDREEQAEDDKMMGLGCCVVAGAEGVPQELLALDAATMERLKEWETDEEDTEE